MVSYDGVILKRLRFKGEPDVPEISPSAVGLAAPEAVPRNPVEGAAGSEKLSVAPDAPEMTDDRTEAEKRFEQKTAAQEQERLREAAAVTYRDQLKKFNENLSKEPEHYDLFKISFTK